MKRFGVVRDPSRIIAVLAGAAVVALLVLVSGSGHSAGASTTTSADHIAVSASDLQVLNQNQQPNANSSTTVQLMSSTFKTSTVEDLVINLSAECGLYTAVGAKGGGSNSTTSSQATGIVTIHLTLDGNPLPTTLSDPYSDTGDPNASPPTTSNGPVVYCNRQLNMQTAGLNLGQLITLFENTRSANSFQWFALNVGNGQHTVTAYATLEADTASSGTNGGSGSTTTPVVTPAASALVGQRTMEVYPAHLANSATF